jgi:hypothetical protein
MPDHDLAKKRLKGREAASIGPAVVDIGNNFIDL